MRLKSLCSTFCFAIVAQLGQPLVPWTSSRGNLSHVSGRAHVSMQRRKTQIQRHQQVSHMAPTCEAVANPFIAVLRGVTLEEIADVARVLMDEGFTMISVTVETPKFLRILDVLSNEPALQGLLPGVSSVTTPDQVEKAAFHGARFVSSMSLYPSVVRSTKDLGLLSIPGVSSPSEALDALTTGGDILKVYPAHSITPPAVKSLLEYLPATTRVITAGGLRVDQIAAYSQAGVAGFAVGSTLFNTGIDIPELQKRARAFFDEGTRCHCRLQQNPLIE
ncbi:unnamed protein product [Discosporangium mesarthrocarpum]